MQSEAQRATDESHQLKGGTLSTWGAVAMAVAVLSPAMAMAYNTTGAATFAGTSTPFAFLLGGIGCLALAFVVIGFTRRMASAGYAYTYASRTLGQSAGFLTGWLYFFGFFCFVPMTMSGVGGFTRDLIASEWWKGIPGYSWFVIFLIGMALLVFLAVYDIKLTARTQLIVGILTVGVIVILDLIVTAKGGANGNTLAPLTPAHTLKGGFGGIGFGLIFGVLSYIGFETSAVLGEETKNPRKAIPVSVVIAVVFAILFYVWTTYSIAIGLGVNEAGSNKWASDFTVLFTISDTYASHFLTVLIEIAAILSAFVVCLACATAAARTMFAMGREGTLPAALGRTHPTYKTPANATLLIAGLATVVAALVGFGWPYDSLGGGPFTVFYLLASIGGLGIIVVYMVLCAAGAVWFRREHRNYNPIVHLLVPALGVIIFGFGLYGSIYPGGPLHLPLAIIPWVILGWIILGVVFLRYLRSRRPEAVARIGSILGEEGGEEAAVLDEPGTVPPVGEAPPQPA
jgi:amino acid transporter